MSFKPIIKTSEEIALNINGMNKDNNWVNVESLLVFIKRSSQGEKFNPALCLLDLKKYLENCRNCHYKNVITKMSLQKCHYKKN